MMWIVPVVLGFCLVQPGLTQDSPAAKATRKKLQQKITVDFKEIGTKTCFDDIKNEMDPPVAFRIDNASGVSNNTKLTFKAKDKTVETILNEMSDKFGFGWFVYFNPKDPNDRYNGWVTIRKTDKGKERGYEAGKEPKGTKTSLNDTSFPVPQAIIDRGVAFLREAPARNYAGGQEVSREMSPELRAIIDHGARWLQRRTK